MTKYDFNQAVPFEATHVGEVIKDELAARGMKQSELSELTCIQRPILNDVIKGKRSLTPEMALLLENALDISATFLLNILTQYELDSARHDKRVVLQTKMLEIWNVLKEQVSIPFFRKTDIVRGNILDDVERIFAVFGVHNLDEFFGLKAEETKQLCYHRKREETVKDFAEFFSWKYYCYYLSRNDDTHLGTFEKGSAAPLTKELNKVFKENQGTVRKTGEVFNHYGIRFMLVKTAGQVPVDGMSFWIGDNPTIIVTERMSSIDNYAFAILHEVGHVYNHLTHDGRAMINFPDDKRSPEEAEADNFARNAIIPNNVWKKFLAKTRDVVPCRMAPYIQNEADKYQVNPQILFGRYKHDIGIYKIKNYFETKLSY